MRKYFKPKFTKANVALQTVTANGGGISGGGS